MYPIDALLVALEGDGGGETAGATDGDNDGGGETANGTDGESDGGGETAGGTDGESDGGDDTAGATDGESDGGGETAGATYGACAGTGVDNRHAGGILGHTNKIFAKSSQTVAKPEIGICCCNKHASEAFWFANVPAVHETLQSVYSLAVQVHIAFK